MSSPLYDSVFFSFKINLSPLQKIKAASIFSVSLSSKSVYIVIQIAGGKPILSLVLKSVIIPLESFGKNLRSFIF